MVILDITIALFYPMAQGEKEKRSVERTVELKQLGDRIKSLRIKAGYSNYEYFAYKHEIPRSQYGRYERGEDLRYSSLVKIVRAFGISMEEFFSEGFD
ncbi:Helix-turn-helix domain protein [compost metagenome]